jgi:hypothetical protein
VRAGRRSGRHCVRPRRGLTRRCRRTVTLLTLARRHTRHGRNRVAFSGRTAKVKLEPGAYRAILRARDSSHNRSAAVTLRFRIVRG